MYDGIELESSYLSISLAFHGTTASICDDIPH